MTILAKELLKRPYQRRVIAEDDGTFFAEIVEFPGCFAVGDDEPTALKTLEEVAVDWIDAALSQGQDIPLPKAKSPPVTG